jgi:hypothetical protein
MSTLVTHPTPDEVAFARVMEKVITDPDFAKEMRADASGALKKAGFTLTPEQENRIKATKRIGEGSTVQPLIVSPAVQVGTDPAVQVAVDAVTS